jgi:hypothetical protein
MKDLPGIADRRVAYWALRRALAMRVRAAPASSPGSSRASGRAADVVIWIPLVSLDDIALPRRDACRPAGTAGVRALGPYTACAEWAQIAACLVLSIEAVAYGRGLA